MIFAKYKVFESSIYQKTENKQSDAMPTRVKNQYFCNKSFIAQDFVACWKLSSWKFEWDSLPLKKNWPLLWSLAITFALLAWLLILSLLFLPSSLPLTRNFVILKEKSIFSSSRNDGQLSHTQRFAVPKFLQEISIYERKKRIFKDLTARLLLQALLLK